jgi:ATP-dependent DNA helicase DinG
VRSAREEQGRVIVLLTNREHLDLVDTPFKQGSMPMGVMIERFKREGGVIAWVDTFWKGIDIPGNKALVISKLPFQNPEDTLHRKRCEFLKKAYGSGMMWRYIKGRAKMNLKQGIGRLKRKREDTGVIYLVDGRVKEKFFIEFLSLLKRYGSVSFVSYNTNPAVA